MKDLIETVAAHPWVAFGMALFAWFGIDSAGDACAKVVRAWRAR